MQLCHFINNAAFPRHGNISAASFEPPLSVKIFNQSYFGLNSQVFTCRKYSVFVYTRGGWVVWVYSYGLMSNANGLFCETAFFVRPL